MEKGCQLIQAHLHHHHHHHHHHRFAYNHHQQQQRQQVPKGYLAISVGLEQKRFTIPTEYLSHPAFHILLREAEEEFGFQQAGVLRIPCEVSVFESVVKIVEEKKGGAVYFTQQQQDCRFDFEDGAAGGYGYCSLPGQQGSAPAHHPQSPMCR
ncbi:unnamed protein product [Linum tenue]|uniref:Uncharacterized protein n=1 Tax=Linum tenue TaxID=586396 RepID=A0AAV0LYS6_9ROSI|nr:unnamed protein product [Linum tenue]